MSTNKSTDEGAALPRHAGPLKVLVVYPFMQHYRLGVFRKMDETADIDYVFASDVVGRKGIEALPTDSVSRHRMTPRREIGRLSWQSGVLSLVAAGRYDAVIFFSEITSVSTWLASMVARLRRRPVFFWTTGWHRPERGMKRHFRNAFYRLSNKLLLYGELGRSIGQQMKFPDKRMAVIGNSVDVLRVNDSVAEEWDFEKPDGAFVVGAVIRLTAVKRLDLIVRAVALLNERDGVPHIVVLLVGEGPERERLEQLGEQLGVDLRLPGAYYSGDALDAIYEDLDATVVPAAVGLTAIQSMSHGVPVISNDAAYSQMPEWESIKPGITGELFHDEDVEELAEAIRRVAELDEAGLRSYQQSCREEVRTNWTAESHAARIAAELRYVSPNRRLRRTSR